MALREHLDASCNKLTEPFGQMGVVRQYKHTLRKEEIPHIPQVMGSCSLPFCEILYCDMLHLPLLRRLLNSYKRECA